MATDYDDVDDGGNVDREALIRRLENKDIPDDLIRAIEEWFEKKDVAKELGVDPEGVDSYLMSQNARLEDIRKDEQVSAEAQSLAAATVVAQDTDGDATDVLDTVVYDQEDG